MATAELEPILNGSMGVGLLSASLAISLYLRNVSAAARDAVDKLLDGKASDRWTPGAEHTERRIAALRATRSGIEAITPSLFWYCIFVSARLAAYAIGVALDSKSLDPALKWFDAVALTLFGIGLVMMFRMHQRAKKEEISISLFADGFLSATRTHFAIHGSDGSFVGDTPARK